MRVHNGTGNVDSEEGREGSDPYPANPVVRLVRPNEQLEPKSYWLQLHATALDQLVDMLVVDGLRAPSAMIVGPG
jgi:hypothetical protein